MKFRSDDYGTITGIRFYKATANTGTHIGSLWTADGQRLAQATFTERDGERAGSRHVLQPGRGPAQHDVRRVLLRAATAASRPRPTTSSAPRAGAERRRARRQLAARTRSGTPAYGQHDQRRVRLRRDEHVPDRLLRRHQLLGRRRLRTRAGARRGDQCERGRRRHDLRQRLAGRRPRTAGPSSSYKITPYVGTTAQTPKTITGSPPVANTTSHRTHHGHDVPLHRPGDQPERRRTGVRAVERGDAAGRRGAGGAHRACPPSRPRSRPG